MDPCPPSEESAMPDDLTVDVLAEDAPFDDAGDEARRSSREAFVQKAVIAGGTLLAGGLVLGGLPKVAGTAPSRAQDVRILNFALFLEYVQAAFYTEAAKSGALDGEPQQLAEVLGKHERAHVAFLRRALGAKARKRPSFDFGDATGNRDKFLATAHLLEETGVAAYIGQAAHLTKRVLVPAATIVSVEARHAAWVRDLVGENPAPLAADAAKTAREVVAAIEKTGFVTSG
jgi:rubrerythrin